ncbi:SpoIIE family protein phosphatase [Nocardioides sp. zg-579]|uniref:histidine kinase n=1 Tax=Nocardioides marmotae TaxID=2663857 RepID=A0A6I3JFY5_9ACTN|nr:SpoIIE family protein phosphatase [Nocardioides marmotae]MCR6033394.1 SpoIIE family protein phosphatase [Gordonia jinghuaiqii]MTB97051.1 SpoIIE family protein phosphatase [Nocardioides marmotae]QKE00712.1 SpoIIE family protein phosphatase [Nocardioides marmotae]
MGAESSMTEALRAAGPVGRDLLEVDWSITSVGEPDTWPLSLRNAVRIMLSSKFSMWMAWGEDLTFFCNEAYRRDTLGTKYPWALARPASEVWREIWPDIGPRIERVMRTGEATWDEKLLLFLERSGYVEETYHTFSYSPLADDDGTIAGMLCVVTEGTEEVISTRRMTTLRDLGIRVGAAGSEAAAVTAACEHLGSNRHSLPFVVVYLFSEDGTVAHRRGQAGISPEHSAAPPVIAVGEPDAVWPLHSAWRGEDVVVSAIDELFPDLPTGEWTEPPTRAYVTPLLQPGQSKPYGALVVGLNRYRPFDGGYRDFLELLAGHLAAAIGDARAIEQEKQRAEELARIDKLKTDFFANVSHELRTPLTLLLAPAEDALSDAAAPLPPAQRGRLEVIARNGRRMLQLVNTLLDFSRLESGRDTDEFLATDLCAYTAELVAMFESAAERGGLTLELECPAPVTAYVDRESWAKVVLNLVSNALKFTFEGGITVRLTAEDDRAVLTVTDTGGGIPPGDLPRLFERFHRATGVRSRTHEGTGIGLSLVRELVEAHGGRVGATSRTEGPDRGTTLTVSVPLGWAHLPEDRVRHTVEEPIDPATGQRARAYIEQSVLWLPPDGEPEARGAGAGTDSSSPLVAGVDGGEDRRGRVLVVDDNADMRRYICDLLAPSYDVRTAMDGLDALDQMSQDVPDLVLTDVMMPELDGFGLLRRMQADPALTSVPVIMLSARAGEEGTLEGLEAGADDYLVKPFSARELLARVRVNLELDQAHRVRVALERSRELLDQAQRLARLGSWEVDLERDSITGSRTFFDMLGITREDAEERGARAIIGQMVHPEDHDHVTAQLAAAAVGETIVYEVRVVTPSGEVRLFQSFGEPATGPDGSRLVRGSFQDITDQRALQQRLVAAEAEREVVERERQIGRDLQASLLPRTDPDVAGLEVATYYRAGVVGTQVGGDWYDVIDLGAGRTAVVIGDVMGRGVRAAAVMGQLRAATRAFAKLDLSPTDVLEHLDPLVQDLAGDQIVTCVYAVFDAADHTLTYANAGHLPPVHAHADGRLTLLREVGPPLGAGHYGLEPTTVQLGPADVLVLYTDGLVERRGEDLQLGLERLSSAVAPRTTLPAAQLLSGVVTALAGDGVDDDVAMVVARAQADSPGGVARFEATSLAEIADLRRTVAEQLTVWAVPPDRIADTVQVVDALVSNVLVHAEPPATVQLRRLDEAVLVEVRDPVLVRPRRRRTSDQDEGGRGLHLVAVLSDDWGSRSTDEGKTVWALLSWGGRRH